MKLAIVKSEFNKKISNNLQEGVKCAYESLFDKTVRWNDEVSIYCVPGAFEIPGFINHLLKKNINFDAIISIGSVIKGETAHFEYISKSVTDGIAEISRRESTNIPIIFGILTAYNYEQALDRSDLNKKNKGGEIMKAAFDIVQLYNKNKK